MTAEAPVAIQLCVDEAGVPDSDSLRIWARAAMETAAGELTIRITDAAESRALNQRYRGRDHATNVLSFNYGSGLPAGSPALLGDLVICRDVVLREAREQGIEAHAHWAHMVVHGVLHLHGMDHETDAEAEAMEARERSILEQLGFSDPYRAEHQGCTGAAS